MTILCKSLNRMLINSSLHLLIVAIITSSFPFYIWGNSFFNIGLFLGYPLSFLLWKRNVEIKHVFVVVLFVCFYFYAFFFAQNLSFFGNILTLFPCCLFLIKDEYWCIIYRKYTFFFSVTLIPSLIVYFLVIWLNISLPYNVIEPINALKTYAYLAYPFCVIPDLAIESFRFCGYYDEPGVIGTIAGVLLVTNNVNLKKWINWPILVAGIFSFSIYFYLLLLLYFFLFSSLKKKIIFLISLFLIILPIKEDPLLDKFLFSRMEFEDGELSGDNRTSASFETWYQKYLNSNKLLEGYGRGKSSIVDSGGASYKHLIVDYGIIAFFIYCFSFTLLYWNKFGFSKNTLLLCVLFCSLIYQRPFVFSLVYLFLLISPAYNLNIVKVTANVSDNNNFD